MTAAFAVESWLRAEGGVAPRRPPTSWVRFTEKERLNRGGTPRRCAQLAIPDCRLQWSERYTTRGVRSVPGGENRSLADQPITANTTSLGYRYRALLLASTKGEYDFQSVMPGHYPARKCQHIHFLVQAEGSQAPGDTDVFWHQTPFSEAIRERI